MGFGFPRSRWSLGRLTVQPPCKSFSVIPKRVRGCWGPGENCKSFTFIALWTYAAELQQPSIPAPSTSSSSLQRKPSSEAAVAFSGSKNLLLHAVLLFYALFCIGCRLFFLFIFTMNTMQKKHDQSLLLCFSAVREDRQQRGVDNVVYLNTIKSQLQGEKNTSFI